MSFGSFRLCVLGVGDILSLVPTGAQEVDAEHRVELIRDDLGFFLLLTLPWQLHYTERKWR